MMNHSKAQTRPEFFCFGGGCLPDVWAFGYWTGPDGDLLCVKPGIEEALWAEYCLSPVAANRILAVLAFFIKRILLRLDKTQMSPS